MIVCDMCDTVVHKRTFCSDKCRVAYHREVNALEEVTIKTPKETFKVPAKDKNFSNMCKHNSLIGLCKFGCK
jgi:hypothetical protein